jgi:hypothetical protein
MSGNQWLSNACAFAGNNGIFPGLDPPEQLEDVIGEGAAEADPSTEEATEEATEDEFDLEAEPGIRGYFNNARRSLGNVDVNLNLSKSKQSNTASGNSLGGRLLGAVDSIGVTVPTGTSGTDEGNVNVNLNLSQSAKSNSAASGNSLRSLGGRLLGTVDSVGVTVPSLPTGASGGGTEEGNDVALNVNLSQTTPTTNATRGQFLGSLVPSAVAPLVNNVLPPNVQIGSGGTGELPSTPPINLNLNLPSKLGGSGNNALSEDGTPSDSHVCGCKRWVFVLIVVLVVVVVALVIGIVAATTNKGNGSSSSSRSIEPEGGGNGSSTINGNPSPSTMAAPTPTRSDAEIQAVVTYLNSQILSAQTLVYPPSNETQTPENLALQWLIENIAYPYTAATDEEKFRIVQSYALLTLFAATDGPRWQLGISWLEGGPDECGWDGATCTSKDLDTIGTVKVATEIFLLSRSLNGPLPVDLGLLTHLESFYVANNELSGSLPATIGRWSLLRKFDVSLNPTLTGTIPDAIANWSVIENISTWGTGLTGSIPEEVCDTALATVACIECTCCSRICF